MFRFLFNTSTLAGRAAGGDLFHQLNASFLSSKYLLSRHFASLNFEEAVKSVNKLKDDPGNESKLQLYGLYKQATVGPCKTSKPGVFDIAGKYKWEAWNKLGDMSKEEAQKQYIATVDQLIESIGLSGEESKSEPSEGVNISKDDKIVVIKRQSVLTIKLNRPKKKNALTIQMYQDFAEFLNNAAKDDTINFALITGSGDYYSSGNDLSNFTLSPNMDVKKMAENASIILEEFVNSLINFPKPLIIAVNGPAVGIMATTLGLADVVICSDKATFNTPFSALAQSPEGCSSYLFPKIMGPSKANEMLLFNRKINAQEALQWGLVSSVVPQDKFEEHIENLIFGEDGYVKVCQPISLKFGKNLIRTGEEKEKLRQINKKECQLLVEAWLAPDFTKVIAKFFARKK